MLTSIPPRLLHVVLATAEEVKSLAELGLAMLCPCATCHGSPVRKWLEDELPELAS